MKPYGQMDDFERAFRGNIVGFRRQCACGKEYFDCYDDNATDDEELEEMKELALAGKIIAVDHAVGSVFLFGIEYVDCCDCWHEKAKEFARELDRHRSAIGKYYEFRRNSLNALAQSFPTIDTSGP